MLRSQNERLQAQNIELQEKFEQSERGVVLLVEALALVHEVIDPLSRRTETAAELLKTAVRIITVRGETNQDEIDEMTRFYNGKADKVTEIVHSGLLAVRNVHAGLPQINVLPR